MLSLRVLAAILVLSVLSMCTAQQVCSDSTCGKDEICVPEMDSANLGFKASCVKVDSRFKTNSAHAGSGGPTKSSSSFSSSSSDGSGAAAVYPAVALMGVTALAAALRLV